MLQSMRELAHSWVAKGVMLFLMVSFSIWGIGDIFRGNPQQKTVAKVGNTDISVQELRHLFEQTLGEARQRFNPDLTEKQALEMGLMDKTLDGEIKRRLIDMDVQQLGIDVSQESVLKMLAEQPQLRDKNGNFNKALFLQFLRQQQKSEQSFLAGGQQEMSRQILLDALSGDHMVPQTEIDALYKARAQKRVLDVVTIDESKIGGIPAPDDKALHSYYDNNQALFFAPEYRAVTVASLSTDALMADINVTDEQVQKEYDAKADQLAHPEQRDILQVVASDEDKAKQLAKAARAKGDLAAAAAAEKESAIPLGQMEEKNLMPELAKVVFALHPGEVSEPVKTQLGWHVVQLKKITPAGKPSFAEVKDKLREDMRRDQAVEAATRTVNQLDDQLAAGHSLDDIADGMKLRMIKIPAVDANGLTPDGKKPAELPNKDQLLKDAFAQGAGETSPIEDDKAGNYYVVRTDDITPAGAKPFDKVKSAVADALKAHEQAQKAKEEADKIAQALRDGKPAASFAGEEGVSIRSSNPLSQLGDSDPLLPQDIIAQAFRLKKGETAQAEADKKQIVARLASVIDADMSKDDPRKNMVSGEIKRTASAELLDQYVQHLYTLFPVKTDAALLDHMRDRAD